MDDCELVRKGVRAVLNVARKPRIDVVAEVGTATAALEACANEQPDVVILEANLPDGSGVDLCRQLAAKHPAVRLLVLTAAPSQSISYEAVVAGAHGCLGKDIRPAALVDAVYDIASGGSVFDRAGSGHVASCPPLDSRKPQLKELSVQQRRVLELLTAGRTNEEIAAELRLSKHTVRNYLVATFRKLGVRRRAQASAFFTQHIQAASLMGA